MTPAPDGAGAPAQVAPGAVTIEFDRSAEPIEGCLRDANGVRRPFAGWLGLLGELDAAIAAGAAVAREDS